MSRFRSYSKKTETNQFEEKIVKNFMNGHSYNINPIDTLKIVSTSSIFGEPAYYRNNHETKIKIDYDMIHYNIFNDIIDKNETTISLFTKVIDNALSYDFKSTLDFALQLRTEFNMRLNPGVILVRAILHNQRKEFNNKYPGYMNTIGKAIIIIPSDASNIFDYYMFINNMQKNKFPFKLKEIIRKSLENFSKYHINKYKSKNLIDLIRITHANNEIINELMKTGKIKIDEKEQTWETLRSQGKNWNEIIKIINIPHMALLRNLRNIFVDSTNINLDDKKNLLTQLKNGVENGKQFPFRYYTAYKILKKLDFENKTLVLDTLEECIDISMKNFPVLKGKTMCLSDNSGSAQGTFNSEFGSVKVSDIANLSSVMTAYNSEEGFVGCFGDSLTIKEISKRNGILSQHENLDTNVGLSTENGIWLFFDKIIKNREHWDNIFIYSDMQAGHGDLYGGNKNNYKNYIINDDYIDVLKLVTEYRNKINPKVNVFSTQVAGYNNSILPENIYRGAILSGWTGKETLFASKIIEQWDKMEMKN